MVPELSLLVRRITFLMLTLGAVGVEVAANDTRSVAVSVGQAVLWVAAAVVVALFVTVPANPRANPPLWVFLLLLLMAVAPFAVEPLRRRWTDDGSPLEIHMVFALRNVGLGLAACGGWFLCLRTATVVSLFLVLFAYVMTSHPAVKVVLALYAVAGGVWLMLGYWGGLKGVFVASEKTVAIEVLAERVRFPWGGLCILVVAISAALVLAIIGPKRSAVALGELVPTSGGTGETDIFARSGIGDGPEETAGDDAKTAGMVETDKMIEDNKNSMIDAVSYKTYGPPHKPPKEMQKMVAAGLVDVIQFHGKLPDNRRPSREFDTSRKGPQVNRTPESRAARGLFEVEGRTPLHIRVVAFDRYDAVRSSWVEGRKPPGNLIEPEGGDWMRWSAFKDFAEWYREDDRHRLKVADLKDNLVPTPAMLIRFRINKVDKPDYYEWDYDGVLALAGRKRTPPGIIVNTDCRTVDPLRLPEAAFGRVGPTSGAAADVGEVPESLRPEIERIAREWAGDKPRGWPQIEAVIAKLRTEYTLDRAVAPPGNHPAPALWFLTESQRGPDYLFATAAALLLRSLDYPTRVCLGFYAAPEAYDPESAHTPVRKSDLHMWAEVRLNDSHWMVIEATPGYDTLPPKLALTERLRNTLLAVAAWAWRHLVEVSFAVVVLLVVAVRRRQIIDALAVRMWRWWPSSTWQEQVRRAVRLLERRGRWTGQPRPVRQSPASWLRSIRPKIAKAEGLDELAVMAEWAAYAPDVPPPWSEAETLAVCRSALDGWPLRRWREIAVPDSAMGA
ncbi:MAG: transglutaminase domain-containing protein [Gemmataceae bacterium]